MRIIIDKESNALYFRLDESRIVDSEEIKPGVIVDYDANRCRSFENLRRNSLLWHRWVICQM